MRQQPLISLIRRATLFVRTTAAAVILAMLSLMSLPLSVAMAVEPPPEPVIESSEAQLSTQLQAMETLLAAAEAKLDAGQDISAEQAELDTLRTAITALDVEVMQHFANIEADLLAKGLPEVILNRHAAAVSTYQTELATMLANLTEIDQAPDATIRKDKVKKAKDHLKVKQKRRQHQFIDPENLPFKTPSGNVREPATTADEFISLGLVNNKPTLLASLVLTPLMMATNLPQPEHLQPTEDVQITQAIQDLADQLNNHPVDIYNWVHNNIEFIPTYGSIQGSDMTLKTRRGNAFDTSSLLIALLRASNIPARYVYGTVEIPIEKVLNWVGGVEDPIAALQLLAQGGIPSTGLTSGGVFNAVRIEHVWVETWIDHEPSRGAKNYSGDSWVPMDGSFKQYQYTEGIDVQGNIPFDEQVFVDQITLIAQINEQDGSVAGIDEGYIIDVIQENALAATQYINNTNPNPLPGDVLGSKMISLMVVPLLSSSLPYKLIARGSEYAEIPDSLRHKFQFKLYANETARVLDSPTINFESSLANVAGQKVTLAFVPASQSDLDTINNYLPTPHPDGSPIQAGELPESLPGYLIQLKSEIRLNGQVSVSSGSFTMGDELVSLSGLYSPSKGWRYAPANRPVAGDYQAIGINLGSISEAQLQLYADRLDATRARLESNQVAGLTVEDTSGDVLYSSVLAYFSAVDRHSKLHQKTADFVQYRLPSFGTFSAVADPIYTFGIPRTVNFPGLVMDIDHLESTAWHKNNNPNSFADYNKKSGLISSAYEHLVPEKLLSDAQYPGEGVSAVKALSLAARDGQRIFTITSGNISTVMPQLDIDLDIKQEIQNAIAAGKEAVVHQSNITVVGWTGAGYMIIDPITGSGAYKISSGFNGNAMTICEGIVFAIQIFIIAALVIALVAILVGGLPGLIAAAAVSAEIMTAVGAFIASSVTVLPVAMRAVVSASIMSFASSQVIAGGVVGEICPLETPFTNLCLYRCASDGKTFEEARLREGGECGRQLNCPKVAKRPVGL